MLLAPASPQRSVNGPLSSAAVTLPTRWLLAPLAGYTNLAFRLAVREITCRSMYDGSGKYTRFSVWLAHGARLDQDL